MVEPPSAQAPQSAAIAAHAVPSANVWERLKHHKVLQWTLAYAAAAYTLLHATQMAAESFDWPHLIVRIVALVLVLGVPIAVLLAWYHGHKAQHRFSTAELSLLTVLLIIAGSILWAMTRTSGNQAATGATRGVLPVALTGPSIAVLPFLDLSPGHDQEYFSDGLAEELINQLSQLPELRVTARASSFTFKGKNEDPRAIGESLGVNHILEGSVRKEGERLRITTQLINPRDGTNLWSGTYERSLGDIFAIQEDIARTVASTLRISIGARDLRSGGTSNLEAYDAYLRALSVSSSSLLADSIPDLQRAVELDPHFTAAWMGLATAYGNNAIFDPSHSAEWQKKSEQAANRVLRLAPESPEANSLKGAQELSNGRFAQAETLLAATQQLPASFGSTGSVSYGYFLLMMGRAQDALPVFRQAVALDPISIRPSVALQLDLDILGQYEQAERESRRVQGLVGDLLISRGLALLRAMEQRDKEAAKKLAPPQLTNPAFGTVDPNGAMAGLLDDPPAALARLRQFYTDPHFVHQPFPLSILAHWAAYFGDPSFSLEVLRALPHKPPNVDPYLLFSLWRPIERDARRLPAFKDFVRELGLVDYWRATGNWGDFCQPVGQNDFTCT
jgi:TolB-like protein/Flp pilus assembly protein TadD